MGDGRGSAHGVLDADDAGVTFSMQIDSRVSDHL
jgi:hypothetical protein